MTQKEYKDALERVNEISAEKAKLEDEISKYRKENYKKMAMECLADEVCEISKDEVIDNIVMPIVDHSYLVIAIIVALYIANLLFDATDFAELLLVTGILCIAIAQILKLKKLLKDK